METVITETEMELPVPLGRECTRCEGNQELLGYVDGLGKYQCDNCHLTIGFDNQSEFPEFLLDTGKAWRYTKQTFGTRLNSYERRIERQEARPSEDDKAPVSGSWEDLF